MVARNRWLILLLVVAILAYSSGYVYAFIRAGQTYGKYQTVGLDYFRGEPGAADHCLVVDWVKPDWRIGLFLTTRFPPIDWDDVTFESPPDEAFPHGHTGAMKRGDRICHLPAEYFYAYYHGETLFQRNGMQSIGVDEHPG